jgi:signal transduction histidine kinase
VSRPGSIYQRLFLPFVAVLLLGTTGAWALGTMLLARSLEQRVAGQLEHADAVLAEQTFPFTPELLERLGSLIQARFVLVEADGGPDPATLPAGETPLATVVGRALATWQASGGARGSLRVEQAGMTYLVSLRALTPLRDPRYRAVAAVADLSDVHRATRQAALWLAGIAGAAVIALAALGHRIARGITGPIAGLAALAGRVAAGDREARVKPAGPAELRALAEALNTMAERLQRSERQAAESSRLAALGQVAARVAHEIRNPLTAIKMQLQLLAESAAGPLGETVTGLLDEVRRLELVVGATLQLARPGPLRRGPADLNAVVGEVLGLLAPQLAHRGVALSTELCPALPPIALDTDRFKQVLLNLLVNAADALPEGGRVRVATAIDAAGAEARLEVDDSGPGVPPERRAEVFAPGASDKPGGLGLGLRLSRELVELHGGRIELDASELGGARFRVCLPIEA